MSLFNRILDQARNSNQRIVLPEGDDPRIVEGAVRALTEELAIPVLLGDAATSGQLLKAMGSSDSKIEVIDPSVSDRTDDYAQIYHRLREHKGMDAAGAAQVMTTDRLVYAATMVREREADGTIGGAVNTTADTVRTALQVIGRAEGVKTVSSFFLILLEREHHGQARILVFADCALIVQPNSDELAQIALSSAASYQSLVKDMPRVAMLSFSTAGSAKHKHVERVRQATELVSKQNPALIVGGDIQFDAAVIPEICSAKAPNSPLKGVSSKSKRRHEEKNTPLCNLQMIEITNTCQPLHLTVFKENTLLWRLQKWNEH